MSPSYTLTEQKLVKLLGETNILIQSIDRTKINTIYPTYILQKRPLFETLYEDFYLEVRAEEKENDNSEDGEKDNEKDDEKDGKKDDVENQLTKDEQMGQNENMENNKPDSSGHPKTLHIFTGDEPILQILAEKSPTLKVDFQRLFSIIRCYQRDEVPTAKEWIKVLFDDDGDERDNIRTRGEKHGNSIMRKLRRKFGNLLGIGGGGNTK